MTEEPFASFAHRRVVGNRKPSVKAIADAMNMKPESLYARLYNRTPLSADELRLFFSVVHDVEIANYLLSLSPLMAVHRSEHTGSQAQSLQRGALKAMLDVTDIVRFAEQSLADGRVDHREKTQIQHLVAEAERALASLRQLLASIG